MRRRFLIVCEGEKTEPNYFRAFPVPTHVQCVVEGDGHNTTSLVREAERLANEAVELGASFDEVWLVYDQDDFGADKFNAAAQLIRNLDSCRDEDWHAAWSNQAFEVWYLLHFQFFDARLHRWEVAKKLTERLGGYRKNDPSMYERLAPLRDTAIRHAERLEKDHGVAPHGDTSPADADPCTLVHRLVRALVTQSA